MKKLLLSCSICLFMIPQLRSQTVFTDTFIGEPPTDIELIGDYLYVGTLSFGIGRIDITEQNPTHEIVSDNYPDVAAWKLAYHENTNTIYVNNLLNPYTAKLDLSQSFPVDSEYFTLNPTGVSDGMTFKDDYLYVSFEPGDIYRMDVAVGPNSFELFYQDPDQLDARNPIIHNNEMYYSGGHPNVSLYKIDLDDPTLQRVLVSEDIGGVVQSSHIADNYLYLGTAPGEIMRFDLSETLPLTKTTVIPDAGADVLGIANQGEELFASTGLHEIITFEDPVLSVDESSHSISLNIYPNPASQRLYMSGPQESELKFTITDIHGREVINAIYSDEGIDLSAITSGVYFITFETEEIVETKKFIKR